MRVPTLSVIALAAASLAAAPALAQECQALVPPVQSNDILAELAFYDFGEHMELQVNTPTQPSGLDFAVQIDGEDRPDILLVPGLDDILLSLTPANGDLAIDLAFLSTIVDGKNLQITGYRDGSIEALASYDIAELAAGLGRRGLR